jgi:chemotaxis protein MotB
MHRSGFAATLLGAGLLLTAGCATQRHYDDAVEFGKNQQTALHERERRIAELEAENAALKRDLALGGVSSASEAGYGSELESRLSELQSKLDGLNRPIEDFERIDVEGGYVLLVADRILFASGSAELSDEGKRTVDKIVAEIGKHAHGRIQVRGHTDSDRVSKPATLEKFPHGNLQLSAARAVEVAAALLATKRVDAKDVAVMGLGQWQPIKPNDSSENKRLNRRVEIFVADSSAAPASAGK